ncbi:cell wall protein IFF6-like isoform X2 [Centruroides sculpturatus]|uniref:cell wall protein IFF6-like isoform X2 n=1 Tax=Centruroides sculpturatus TaxID=218467 RepID=UPI000C6E616C|nr:cell wall protein IFF6-like isoform X2 [Centruroides sculpturatus]
MRAALFLGIGQFTMLKVLAVTVFLVSICSPSRAKGIYQFIPQSQIDVASPFAFRYSAEGADGGSSREEFWDAAGNVKGGYSLSVNDGRSRRVEYNADASGFKAKIDTNELGTKSANPADVAFRSSAPSTTQESTLYNGGSQVFGPIGVDTGGAPAPYSFHYAVTGDDGGNSHQESSDGAGNVRGSYSLNIKDGRRRKVEYSAGAGGFKASVNTNEPGTKSVNPADVTFYSGVPLASPELVYATDVSAPAFSGVAKGSGVSFQSIPESGAQQYSFGYTAEGVDGSSSHQESSDGAGNVKGSYSLSIKDGRRRKVDYTADSSGFQASVDTNEPGTKSENPAQVSFLSSAPQLLPIQKSVVAQAPATGATSGYSSTSFQLTPGNGQAPKPYSFSYTAEGDDGGSSHQQSSDGSGNVKGTYSLNVLKDGRRRKVDYTADAGGFKATIGTNEPGTKSESPAQVTFLSATPEIAPVGIAQVPVIPAIYSGGPSSSAVSFDLTPGSEEAPKPYSFGYTAEGIDGVSAHQESSDGAGNVKGSYSLNTKDGRTRKVDYTADAGGFKASVNTNEQGTKSENPAQVLFHSTAPQVQPVFVGASSIIPIAPITGEPSSYAPSNGGVFTGTVSDAKSPYSFSYTAEGVDGGSSHQETSDGSGNVKGSYSLKVKDGRSRKVDYTADKGGFKASINTNEPGTKSDNPAHVTFYSSDPQISPILPAAVPVYPVKLESSLPPAYGGTPKSSAVSFQITPGGENVPSPYSFSYAAEGDDGGNSHRESSDGAGNVKGSYSLNVKDGRRRKVSYSANAGGFQANVDTNEPGTKSENPAHVSFLSSAALPVISGGVPAPKSILTPVSLNAGEGAASYTFDYKAEGKEGGSSRWESSDGAGNVKGSYSLNVKDGRSRKVDYTAGAGGFKASVDTNEPGTKSSSPAEVSFLSTSLHLTPDLRQPVPALPSTPIHWNRGVKSWV